MADDPRIEPLARALFEQTRPAWSWDRPPTGGHEAQQQFWRDRAATLLYAQIDAADPLRALLANPDRALAEPSAEQHCPTCICGRRAPVRASMQEPGRGPGTISWEEHLEASSTYSSRYPSQSAERLAERGGFGYHELAGLLGHEPTTWAPVAEQGIDEVRRPGD